MTQPHYADQSVTIWHGDCIDVMRRMPPDSVDSIVGDPPYNLDFMGRDWDRHATPAAFQAWCTLWATEAFRVLKPGGHMLAFGGTRTSHRLTSGIEDAGFEIRDSITWLYGSGFPKSLDVGKAIDKAAGAEREVIGDKLDQPGYHLHGHDSGTGAFGRGLSSTTPATRAAAAALTAPATDEAKQWEGWGTALKPASEPITVARKPFPGTVANNVLAHGTGALNIDASRVASTESTVRPNGPIGYHGGGSGGTGGSVSGRWPTNVVLTHSGSEEDGDACADGCVEGCPVAELDAQSGTSTSVAGTVKQGGGYINGGRYGADNSTAERREGVGVRYGDSGGASRFFPTFRYQSKAPTSERPSYIDASGQRITHSTVKPVTLMRWLVALVTPPGGTVLDPFAGSGAAIEAAILEGFAVIEIEQYEPYLPLIKIRIDRARAPQPKLKRSVDPRSPDAMLPHVQEDLFG